MTNLLTFSFLTMKVQDQIKKIIKKAQGKGRIVNIAVVQGKKYNLEVEDQCFRSILLFISKSNCCLKG